MPNFTIAGRLGAISDIQRTYMYELLVPGIKSLTNGVIDEEALIVRVRSIVIPSKTIETITSYFMGMEQYWPGRAKVGGTMAISLDETEDQIVLKGINEWQKNIIDTDPDSVTAGYSKKPNKKAICAKAIIKLYRYDGVQVPNDINVFNCWPNIREAVTLNMEDNSKLSQGISLTYDYFTVTKKV